MKVAEGLEAAVTAEVVKVEEAMEVAVEVVGYLDWEVRGKEKTADSEEVEATVEVETQVGSRVMEHGEGVDLVAEAKDVVVMEVVAKEGAVREGAVRAVAARAEAAMVVVATGAVAMEAAELGVEVMAGAETEEEEKVAAAMAAVGKAEESLESAGASEGHLVVV